MPAVRCQSSILRRAIAECRTRRPTTTQAPAEEDSQGGRGPRETRPPFPQQMELSSTKTQTALTPANLVPTPSRRTRREWRQLRSRAGSRNKKGRYGLSRQVCQGFVLREHLFPRASRLFRI